MTRVIVCSLLLLGFISGLNYGLRQAAVALDFWSFIGLCAALLTVIIVLAFSWDHFERTRSPRSPR